MRRIKLIRSNTARSEGESRVSRKLHVLRKSGEYGKASGSARKSGESRVTRTPHTARKSGEPRTPRKFHFMRKSGESRVTRTPHTSRRSGADVKKPNAVIYFLVYVFIYPIFKIFFRLKVDREDYAPPKGPFIVLSNHTSFMDFLLTMLTIYPRRLNAVAAQKFYLYKPLNKLLPLMGCIPKNLFDPDIRSIKGIIKVLGRGDRILLYPEGRCTVAGAYMGMHESTGKLIKKFGAPVLSCHIDGAYTCMPFWRKGMRFGRVRVTLANLFSAEDTREMSEAEINCRIDARLGGLDARPPKKPLRVLRARRLAEGLQNILYYCPSCGSEFTLETAGNVIRCSVCGFAAEMGRDAKIAPMARRGARVSSNEFPDTAQKWYKLQCEHETRSLTQDMPPLTVNVTVRMPGAPGKGIVPCGRGALTLDPKGWRYDGELNGAPASLVFPIDTVPAMPFDPDDNFQIYANGGFYSFTPEGDAPACAKYATIGECAYWKFASPVRMTPGCESGFPVNDRSNDS